MYIHVLMRYGQSLGVKHFSMFHFISISKYKQYQAHIKEGLSVLTKSLLGSNRFYALTVCTSECL